MNRTARHTKTVMFWSEGEWELHGIRITHIRITVSSTGQETSNVIWLTVCCPCKSRVQFQERWKGSGFSTPHRKPLTKLAGGELGLVNGSPADSLLIHLFYCSAKAYLFIEIWHPSIKLTKITKMWHFANKKIFTGSSPNHTHLNHCLHFQLLIKSFWDRLMLGMPLLLSLSLLPSAGWLGWSYWKQL